MAFVAIGDAILHYVEEGEAGAPALILSNSLAADVTMWDRQVERWARRFRVVRYDQRGHGRSSAPGGDYTMERLGRDALALMNHLSIERADWCGVSMGGMTGLWLAIHAPERLGRLVVANSAAHMGPPALWDGRIATARTHGMAALADATLERWFPADFRARESDLVSQVRRVIVGTKVDGYAGCCAAIRDMDLREEVAAIAHETLVIVGEKDPATPPVAGEWLHARIGGSRLAQLDAAHVSNLERPEEFGHLVEAFLGLPRR